MRTEAGPRIPDSVILAQVRQGDVQAYGQLIARYEQTIFATVLCVTRDRHEAEDVTQEVFTQGYLKLRTLRDDSRFVHWLAKIARREARRASKRKRRTRDLAICSAIEPTAVGCDRRLLDEDKEQVLWHVQQLPAHERVVVALRYFDGHSIRRIAEMTGRPVGTITKQLSRAVERLRRAMESETSHARS